jgi:hypothetical protein
MNKPLLLIALMLGMVTLKSQIFVPPPLIMPYRDAETQGYQINLPEFRAPVNSKSLLQPDQTLQSSYVIHKYYTLSNYDINVYGTDALEMDGYIYLNGDYRDMPPGALKPSIWKSFTMKLDQNGDKVWVRTDSLGVFDHNRTYMHNLIELSDGNLLSMGEYVSFDSVQRFINEKTFFIKLDTAGNLKWSRIVELPDSLGGLIWSLDVVAEPDGGFTTQAYTVSESRHLGWDSIYYGDTTFVTVVKFDSVANIKKMNRFFVGTHKTMVMCSGILKTEDGGYLLAGHNEFKNDPNWSSHFNRKYYLLKLDSGLNLTWTKIFDKTLDFLVNKLCVNQSKNGGFLFATTDGDSTYPVGWGYIHYGKMDIQGNIVWQAYHGKYLHPNGLWLASASPMGIVEDEAGNIVVASQVNGHAGVYLFCSDTLGNEKWSRWVPYWGEFLYNMRKAESDGFLITGVGLGGAWLAKTDSIGCVMPGCIDTLMHIGMDEVNLLKGEALIVYPNPTNDILYLALNVPGDKIITAELYNLQGKLMSISEPENILVEIDVSSFATGIYVVKIITTSGNIITKKVVKK